MNNDPTVTVSPKAVVHDWSKGHQPDELFWPGAHLVEHEGRIVLYDPRSQCIAIEFPRGLDLTQCDELRGYMSHAYDEGYRQAGHDKLEELRRFCGVPSAYQQQTLAENCMRLHHKIQALEQLNIDRERNR